MRADAGVIGNGKLSEGRDDAGGPAVDMRADRPLDAAAIKGIRIRQHAGDQQRLNDNIVIDRHAQDGPATALAFSVASLPLSAG